MKSDPKNHIYCVAW